MVPVVAQGQASPNLVETMEHALATSSVIRHLSQLRVSVDRTRPGMPMVPAAEVAGRAGRALVDDPWLAVPELPYDGPIVPPRLFDQITADACASHRGPALQAGLAAAESAGDAARQAQQQDAHAAEPLLDRIIQAVVLSGVADGVMAALASGLHATIQSSLPQLMTAAQITAGATAGEQQATRALRDLSMRPLIESCCREAIEQASYVVDAVPINDNNLDERLRAALGKGVQSGLDIGLQPLIAHTLQQALNAAEPADRIRAEPRP